jgi:acetyl-CoA C-acetyltransferase/3-oxo-5,6-didehydrosuberyl-CoA/3-oxoadipyl-CoA thiolase
MDLVEVNEAFASVVLACVKELEIPLDKLNVNGGAIALGHPLGCSGARILSTLVNELERRKLKRGLITMCVGFGQGIATIVELI